MDKLVSNCLDMQDKLSVIFFERKWSITSSVDSAISFILASGEDLYTHVSRDRSSTHI